MRRFYAFLIMVISILAVVLFNVQGQFELFDYGLEYDTGTEITYSIIPDEENLNNFDIQDVAKVFNDRLEQAGAKNYYVYAKDDVYVADESNQTPTYQITIRLSGLISQQTNILRSVENYGKFFLTSTNQDYQCTDEGEDIVRGSAKIEYNGSSASIVVDTTSDFKDNVGSHLTGSTTGENDEDSTEGDKIILWRNYVEGVDSYEEAIASETNDAVAQRKMREKIIAILDANAFNKDESKLTFTSLGFVSEGVSTETLNAESAHSLQRVLNSELLNYEIERLYVNQINAQYGNNSHILIAVAAISIVLIASALLIFFYGINGVAGAGSLILSLFLSIVLYNFFGLSIAPALLISFIVSVCLCLVILCGYFSRYKNELYKGRTPSKANKESFRGNISTVLDTLFFTLITNIILALLSKNSIQNFSLFLIMSVIVDIIVCLFLTRIMLYFIGNSKLAENKKLFRVKTELIPDLNKEEEQKYFSPFENFDVKKHKKVTLGIFSALSLISLVAVLLFTFVKGSSTFSYTNEFDTYTTIQIVDTHGEDHFATKEAVNNFFKQTIDKEPYEVSITVTTDPNDYSQEADIYYVEAKFNLSIEEIETYKDSLENVLIGDDYNFEFAADNNPDETHDAIYYFAVTPQATTKNFNNALMLIGVTMLCTIVYCFVRFRYTFALSTIVTSIGQVLITTGILAITRIPVSPNLGIALLASVLMTTLFEFILLERYGQYKQEMKNNVLTLENRKTIAELSLKRSMSTLLIIALTIILGSLIMLFISPLQMYSLYFVTILGLLLGLFAIVFIFIPVYNFSEAKLRIKFKPRSNKKKNKVNKQEKVKRTSREVEEIIIPGIND